MDEVKEILTQPTLYAAGFNFLSIEGGRNGDFSSPDPFSSKFSFGFRLLFTAGAPG